MGKTTRKMRSRAGTRDSREPIVRSYDRNHPFAFQWRSQPEVSSEDLRVGPALKVLDEGSPFPACYLPPRISVNACYIFDRCGMEQDRKALLNKYHRSWITKDTLRKSTLGYSNAVYAKSFTDDLLVEAVQQVRDEFRNSLIDLLKPWSVEKVVEQGTLPSSTSPGLPFMQMGYTSKKEAWHDFKSDIIKAHERIRKGHRPNTPDCAAFARSIVSENTKNKVRLVWAYPLEQVLLESKYVQPLLEAMIQQRIGQTVAYGAETQRGGMQWLHQQLSSMGHMSFACIDFSSYDQTIPAWLIRIAFDILEECFDASTLLDVTGERKTDSVSTQREWRAIRNYFINTPLRMEDGTRYMKTGGVPSGSCFTNIIDSIVNMIITRYCFKRTTGFWPSFLVVLGDDSVVASLGTVNLFKIAECCKDMFGIIVNTDKSFWTSRPENVQFLGYFNYFGYPMRDEESLLAGLLLPDSSVDESLALTAARFLGIAQASCGASAKIVYLVEQLFLELKEKGKDFLVDARKLYHIRKMHGWLPAAGEEGEPLPDPLFVREHILPKNTCQKLLMNINLVK